MTSIYLNPPPSSPFTFMEIKDEKQHDQLQLFLSPPQQAAANTHHQDQRVVLMTEPDEEHSKPLDHLVYSNFLPREGSSDQQASSSCSVQSMVADVNGVHNLSFGRKLDDGDNSESASENNGSSVKWMSSKMRLMKKMMNSNCHGGEEEADNNINKPVKITNKFRSPIYDNDHANSFSKTAITIRVCSDCNTTTTPLWRSGPRGPKSLCNACGIRQRKARRAMEAAAAANGGAAVTNDASSMKIKLQMNKEKKSRTSHVGQYKKQSAHFQSQKKICSFKEFALSLTKNSGLQNVFPQDVEDAAILLMELSCGLVHS